MKPKRSEDFYIKVLLQKVPVKEIMVSPVISIKVDSPFSLVEEKFRTCGIRHLPIVDDRNVLVGLITQRDLYRIVSPRKLDDGGWYYDREMLNGIILSRVMIDRPAVIHPDDSVGTALLMMVNGKYGCLPVVDAKQQLCGIITQMDILKTAAEVLRE